MIIDFLNIIQDFGQNNSSIEMFLKGGALYLGLFWVALMIWVAKDAINRSNSIFFHVFSIVLNIFLPVFGLIIYLLIRPSRTLIDKYYEDLEFQALSQGEKEICIKCNSALEKNYKFCGNCGDSLLKKCCFCSEEYNKKCKNCPFCGKKESEKNDEKIEKKEDKKENKKKK